jgi:hypothetical protein
MRLTPRLLRVSLAALLPAAGIILGLGSTASATTHPTSAAANRAALIREITRELHQGHPTMHRVHGSPLDQVQSTNWSGYANTGSGFTKVVGDWTEPKGTCGSVTSLAAFWVGIDGYSSQSVEQDGTLIQCVGGSATYYSWWEMYPSNAVQVVSTSVVPGDKIVASVVRSGTSYTLKVTDSTHSAASFTTTQTCSSCANSSAEWIAEAPSGSAGVYPLTNFGKWTDYGSFVAAGSKTGSISSFTNHEITMVDSSGNVEAQPSALYNSGKDFGDQFHRST